MYVPHQAGSQRSEAQTITTLTLAALGVVYGDIGTSPLYAFKEAFGGTHALPLTTENVLAVLSMMFWAVTLVVSVKYVTFMPTTLTPPMREGQCLTSANGRTSPTTPLSPPIIALSPIRVN